MNFYICDDDEVFLNELSEEILKYSKKTKNDLVLKAFSSGKELLDKQDEEIDVAFLDIDLPEISGFEIAKNVKNLYPNCIIIFCSSHNELVYESFEYEPFWFLCKSDYERKLFAILEKILIKVKEYKKEFVIKFKDKLVKLRYQEIYYVEVEKHKIRLHLEKEILEYRGNLSDIENEFTKMGFVKINSGCMVNTEYIYRIHKNELILKNGTLLVISRSNQKKVKNIFYTYLLKE